MTASLDALRADINGRLDEMRSTGVFKPEWVMVSPQGTHVVDAEGRDVLNLCANNYLGLADDPRVVAAAEKAVREWG
jgi:glycine C-acetyltransferase